MQGKRVVACKNQREYLCNFCGRPVQLKKTTDRGIVIMNGSAVWPISVSQCSCVLYLI